MHDFLSLTLLYLSSSYLFLPTLIHTPYHHLTDTPSLPLSNSQLAYGTYVWANKKDEYNNSKAGHQAAHGGH